MWMCIVLLKPNINFTVFEEDNEVNDDPYIQGVSRKFCNNNEKTVNKNTKTSNK